MQLKIIILNFRQHKIITKKIKFFDKLAKYIGEANLPPSNSAFVRNPALPAGKHAIIQSHFHHRLSGFGARQIHPQSFSSTLHSGNIYRCRVEQIPLIPHSAPMLNPSLPEGKHAIIQSHFHHRLSGFGKAVLPWGSLFLFTSNGLIISAPYQKDRPEVNIQYRKTGEEPCSILP
jgi:hypothetical protein